MGRQERTPLVGLEGQTHAYDASDGTPRSLVQWEQEILDAAVYRPLAQSTAVVDAYEHLRQAIVLCLLPAGSKLPTEPVLAERLGVGVVTMRMALAMLREENFIVTTRGRSGGSWVAEDVAIVEATARTTAFSIDELRDTIDLLIALETQSVGLAALRATAAERAVITQLGAFPRSHLSARDWQMYANVFQLRIAHSTHNPVLASAIRSARARVQALRTAGAGRIVFCVHFSEYHRGVAECIARGDAVGARGLCFRFMTECWDCNLTVIECRNTRDAHLVDELGGGLAARRYVAEGAAVAPPRRMGLRLVEADAAGGSADTRS
jgi:DNA-binding FadR family transcriptional regulator